MNELALFAGNGGGLLAGAVLGWRPVCAVEISVHSRSVLVARQNDGSLRPFPIWDDIKTFDGRRWRGVVDIVSGGFPCQAYSKAAAGRNNAEDLWPEMRRVVADAAPRYVFAENVSRQAIDAAADDLEEMGYETVAIPLGAKDLGGDHIRNRYWLLAYADDKSELLRGLNAKVADSEDFSHGVWSSRPWRTRVDDGLASRMERYTGSGNGQIPIVAVTALRLMAAA